MNIYRRPAKHTQLKLRATTASSHLERINVRRLSSCITDLFHALTNPAFNRVNIFLIIILLRRKIDFILRITQPLVHLRLIRTNIRVATYPEVRCLSYFRFRKEHLSVICTAFGISNTRSLVLSNGCRINEEEAFLFMLHRISHLTTLFDLEEEWGHTNDVLSRTFNRMIVIIYFRFQHLLRSNLRYFQPRLRYYNEKIQARIVAPVPVGVQKVGFTVDATVLQVSNPGGGLLLKVIYNG
jgi:hypothetical protein